jgi:hypothetical protein
MWIIPLIIVSGCSAVAYDDSQTVTGQIVKVSIQTSSQIEPDLTSPINEASLKEAEIVKLALMVNSTGTYILDFNDCTQYAYNLCKNLTAHGFNARMVTGYYGEKGGQRYWHRWVETEDYVVEANGAGTGIVSHGYNVNANQKYEPAIPNYDRSYATEWGWCHTYG